MSLTTNLITGLETAAAELYSPTGRSLRSMADLVRTYFPDVQQVEPAALAPFGGQLCAVIIAQPRELVGLLEQHYGVALPAVGWEPLDLRREIAPTEAARLRALNMGGAYYTTVMRRAVLDGVIPHGFYVFAEAAE